MHYVVDGMNVIGARPDGWWRDRRAARVRLVEELDRVGDDGDTVTVVFDGRPGDGEVAGETARGVRVRFAPGGPNAADDAIVDLVGRLVDRSEVTVVTSDAELADRVRDLGTRVEGAKAFRSRVSGPTDGPRRR